MKRTLNAIAMTTAASLVLAGAAVLPARADVAVVVNGQSVGFDQPPIERAGRVFVPLRGVFERLGASVVYDNGLINADGNGRNISLHIGSTQATVNGATQMLDVAPFVVGSRTLVPLRFVAQALGAAVDWNQASQTVTITGGGGSYNPPPSAVTEQLTNTSPAGVVRRNVAGLSARFTVPVDRNSVRVRIDGVDVTANTTVMANRFNTTLPQQLSQGSHSVRVTGRTQSGARFTTGWTFRTVQGL